MSPSRTRKPIVRARPRSEVVIAVIVGVAVVGGTTLLVWLLRPGTRGVPGTGGLVTRQPRVAIWLVLSAVVIAGVISWLLRGRRRPRRWSPRTTVTTAAIVLVAGAVLAGILWPGGLLRDYPSRPKVDNTPITAPPTTTNGSTTNGSTTGGSTTPGATVNNSTPTSGSVASTTPTTKG